MRVCTLFLLLYVFTLLLPFEVVYFNSQRHADNTVITILLQTVNSSYSVVTRDRRSISLRTKRARVCHVVTTGKLLLLLRKALAALFRFFSHCRYLLDGKRPTVRVLRRTERDDSRQNISHSVLCTPRFTGFRRIICFIIIVAIVCYFNQSKN